MSVAWEVFVVAAHELRKHVALAQLIVKPSIKDEGVYNGLAPAHARLPYIILGDVNEVRRRTFAGGFYRDELLVHLYSGDLTSYEVLRLYSFMEEALNERSFPLAGGRTLTGRTTFVGIQEDQDGRANHGVARYNVRVA